MSLNERQKKFCEHYAACLNATKAAVKAGYSEKTARSIGQRLLTIVDIQNYIATLTQQAKNERIATINDVLAYLSNTMRNEDEITRERTKAAQCLSSLLLGTSRASDDDVLSITFEIKDLTGGEKLED